MGVTYLGQRAGDSTQYAIKVVKPSFQGTSAQIAEFLSAARFLTQLDHPHIARLLEVAGCPIGFYLASEFVPGCNAAQILQRDGPLSVKRTIRWAEQVLQALKYAHGKHFVHRDIKPANVVIVDNGGQGGCQAGRFRRGTRFSKCAPFSGLSFTAALLDLASFIPPEVLFNFQETNPRADQFAVAAVLYHLLTGAPVLEMPKEEGKRYSSFLRRTYVPIRERREDVPAALADVLHRALARGPSQRYGDVSEFRQALIRSVQAD